MKVSVIIPYKEDRGYLKLAVASVPSYCELILSKSNWNVSTNINLGFERSKGDYIKYLNDDDMLTANCIVDSVEGLKHYDIIHGNAYMMHPGRVVEWRPKIFTPTLAQMLVRNPLHGGTLMYKRKVFETIGGFDESLSTCEEYEFNMRALKAGFKIGYVDSFLAYYRYHPQQKTKLINEKRRNIDRQRVRNMYLDNNV